MYSIMAIKLSGRNTKAPHVQEILTRHGCNIATRVGFHETGDDKCSSDGFIVLQLRGQQSEIKGLYDELSRVEGVTPRIIEF